MHHFTLAVGKKNHSESWPLIVVVLVELQETARHAAPLPRLLYLLNPDIAFSQFIKKPGCELAMHDCFPLSAYMTRGPSGLVLNVSTFLIYNA